MDIKRDTSGKKTKQIIYGSVVAVVVISLTVFLSTLERAAPTVQSATLWMDQVHRGELLLERRGAGTLVPEEIEAYAQDHSTGLPPLLAELTQATHEKFGGLAMMLSGQVEGLLLQTLAASIGEDKSAIEDIYEPYLIQLGFLARTSRGRVATELAYEHFGIPKPGDPPPSGPQPELW